MKHFTTTQLNYISRVRSRIRSEATVVNVEKDLTEPIPGIKFLAFFHFNPKFAKQFGFSVKSGVGETPYLAKRNLLDRVSKAMEDHFSK